MKLDNTISAIVTGGASGLGEAVARYLAGQGVRVSLFDLNETRGAQVAQEIGGLFVKTDITSDDSVEQALATAREQFGQERILVNCAGMAYAMKTVSRDRDSGALKHFPLGSFSRVLEVNLLGTYRCIAKSALGMATLEPGDDGERGVIVNTASVAAEDGQVGQCAYSASKAGVVGMTLPLARDLMDFGIRVNTILPGVFETPMMQGLPQAVQEALGASVPFPKRLGYPSEFASLVHTLITNTYFNGASIRLDGAIRMTAK